MMFQELSEEKRMQIKQNTVLSQAVQLITQEYPEKFAGEDGSQIKASIQGDIIWITGEMNLFDKEAHKKAIEFDGEKEDYTIFLVPS